MVYAMSAVKLDLSMMTYFAHSESWRRRRSRWPGAKKRNEIEFPEAGNFAGKKIRCLRKVQEIRGFSEGWQRRRGNWVSLVREFFRERFEGSICRIFRREPPPPLRGTSPAHARGRKGMGGQERMAGEGRAGRSEKWSSNVFPAPGRISGRISVLWRKRHRPESPEW